MVVERRDAQDFTAENFFSEHLQNVGEHRDNQQERDDRQDADSPAAAERVGKERDDRERERQRHGACLGEIKARRRNVKPQKSQEPAGECCRERRDVHLVLKEGDAGVCRKYRSECSSCKPVDAVDDAAGVYKQRNQCKKRDNERSELERTAQKRKGNSRDAELAVEPPSAKNSDRRDNEQAHAQFDAGAADNFEQVVYKADQCAHHERRERQPRLPAADKRQVAKCQRIKASEYREQIGGQKHARPYYDASEARRPDLACLVQAVKLACRGAVESRLPSLGLPHPVAVKYMRQKRGNPYPDEERQRGGYKYTHYFRCHNDWRVAVISAATSLKLPSCVEPSTAAITVSPGSRSNTATRLPPLSRGS